MRLFKNAKDLQGIFMVGSIVFSSVSPKFLEARKQRVAKMWRSIPEVTMEERGTAQLT